MAVDVHSGTDVLVAKVLLRYLDVHSLHQHNGCTKVSEIVEPTLGKICLLLQLGQQLRKVLWTDRFSIGMHDNIVSVYITWIITWKV